MQLDSMDQTTAMKNVLQHLPCLLQVKCPQHLNMTILVLDQELLQINHQAVFVMHKFAKTKQNHEATFCFSIGLICFLFTKNKFPSCNLYNNFFIQIEVKGCPMKNSHDQKFVANIFVITKNMLQNVEFTMICFRRGLDSNPIPP